MGQQGLRGVFGLLFYKTSDVLRSISGGLDRQGQRLYGMPPQYECPICGLHMNAWIRFARRITDDTYRVERACLCPRCKSFERHRTMWLYLNETELLKRSPRFIHFAPEAGLEKRLRSVLGDNYVTTDLHMQNVDVQCDITSLDFRDNSFDLIYCSNILKHIPNDSAAMHELYRILSPEGLAIIQVPLKGDKTFEDPAIVSPEDRDKYFGQADHIRMYGADIRDRLQ